LRDLLADGTRQLPLFDVEGPNRVMHTVWQIGSPAAIGRLAAALNGLEALYIADGHHRSAAAARVAASRRAAQPAAPGASYEYFLTIAFPHDEMRILDYNRVVADLNGLAPAALLERIGAVFDVAAVAVDAKDDVRIRVEQRPGAQEQSIVALAKSSEIVEIRVFGLAHAHTSPPGPGAEKSTYA
jgi:uncharacterized protein (DUF1015 family)